MRTLVAALNASLPWFEAVLNGTQRYPHNNLAYKALHISRADVCHKISVAELDTTSLCRLCSLYAMDYACLGATFYPAKHECTKCHAIA